MIPLDCNHCICFLLPLLLSVLLDIPAESHLAEKTVAKTPLPENNGVIELKSKTKLKISFLNKLQIEFFRLTYSYKQSHNCDDFII